jgi:L-threonylcarbamoyladenylate synthase
VKAIDVIRSGGVVGVPTDTVYGLAVDPRSETAVVRLFDLKGRPADRPVALLAADLETAAAIVVITAEARRMAQRWWPGALTMVLEPVEPLPAWVGHPVTRSVGIRVPDHSELRELLAETGPLAVTSANLSGEEPALDERQAEAVFGGDVDLYVRGQCQGGSASTVVDLTSEPPRVVRPGPIDPLG